MKQTFARLSLLTFRLNRQHLQAVFALLALVLLVLGAGAPDDGGIGGGLK